MQTPDALFLALQAAVAGRYSLERELGRGGMGIVYLARDVQLDRPVALKLLPPEQAALPDRRARFLREARLAARLAHPNIVPIHAVEEVGAFVFFAMRYVAGESLGERLRREGRLAPHVAGPILRDVAYALAYAHAQDVVHRDIKPDNILLDEDGTRALVTDFGIAVLRDDAQGGGRIVGTPEYVAPEQAAGEAVDGRSDLYALGAMGFHALSGRPPFQGTVAELISQHLTTPAPPLLSVVPELRPALAAAIDRALAKHADDRFPTAEAMAEALEPPRALTQELPVPVRVWVERGRELKAFYLLWSIFFYGAGTLAFVITSEVPAASAVSMVLMILCGMAAVFPWVGHGLWRIHETRRALEAGVTLDELRQGLDVALARREEELRYEVARPIHWIPKLVRVGTYMAFTGAMAALIYGVFFTTTRNEAGGAFGMFNVATIGVLAGSCFGLVFPGRRIRPTDPFARLRRWMWNSPFGDLMAKLSAFGLRRTPRSGWAEWRPTELALGSATETLFMALPDGVRSAFADLPQVVSRLEREAEHARRQVAAGAEGNWAARLQQSVAAIDTLRVGLLRMSAGRVEAGSLTADLEAARELAERMGYLVDASDDVASLLDRSGASVQSKSQAFPRKSAPTTSLG
ncbi:MAG: serine/threonine-protein kinase [Gemmatimonadales bacterium]